MKQKTEKESIYSRALKHFGREKQLNKVEEELLELTLAVKHYKDDKATLEDVISEFADVKIVLNYIELILQNDYPGWYIELEILDETMRKIDRLEKLISKEK